MQVNILAIVNTFKLDGIPKYLSNCLQGWRSQCIPNANLDIILANNMPIDSVPLINNQLSRENNHTFYAINCNEHYSVYSMFNVAIKTFNTRKIYDYYVYCAEDCVMTKENDLETLINEFNADDIGIVSALVDNDNSQWYPHYNDYDQKKTSEVSIGESVNMHQFVFSRQFMEKYDFKYPDILGAWATESVLTFLNSAINMKWLHCHKVVLNHQRSWKEKGFDGYCYLGKKSIKDIFENGQKVGLGFECCKNMYPYDKSLYAENKCLCYTALYEYIKENLFLNTDEIDYAKCVSSMEIVVNNVE